jgi:hypothetical protein
MSKFLLTQSQALIENVLLSMVQQYGVYGAEEQVKNAILNGKSDSLQGNQLDLLKQAGVTVESVRDLVKIYSNNRQITQKVMIEMLEQDTNLTVEGAKDAVSAFLAKDKLPENAKGTLKEDLFDLHINAMTTEFVFLPSRLEAAAALIKNGFTATEAFKMIDQTRGEIVEVIPQTLNQIKEALKSLITAIVTEQVVPIEDVVLDMQEVLFNGKPSKFEYKHEYGSMLSSLTKFVLDKKIMSMTPEQLIFKLITGPMKAEIEKDAIRAKEAMADSLLMHSLFPHLKLPAELVPTNIERVDATKMINQKMYRLTNGFIKPWELNNSNFTIPAPVCPQVTACPAAIASATSIQSGYSSQQVAVAVVGGAVLSQVASSLYRRFFSATTKQHSEKHDIESGYRTVTTKRF